MIFHITRRLLPALVIAVIALTTAVPLHAADRGPGGMRQQPLDPGGDLRQPPMMPGARDDPGRRTDSIRPPRNPGIIDSPGSRLPTDEDRVRPESRSLTYRGTRYLINAGRWYEQRGADLVPVAPPAGVLVEELPAGHSMRWVGGVPYFYADGLYYIWRERARRYEILQSPPAGDSEGRTDPAREPAPVPPTTP